MTHHLSEVAVETFSQTTLDRLRDSYATRLCKKPSIKKNSLLFQIVSGARHINSCCQSHCGEHWQHGHVSPAGAQQK